jgi:molybdate-binding protein
LEINENNLRMFPICQQINFNIKNKKKASAKYLMSSAEGIEEIKNSEMDVSGTNMSANN